MNKAAPNPNQVPDAGTESPDAGLEIPGFRARREAREESLIALYESEAAALSAAEVLAKRLLSPPPYAVEVVTGVTANLDAIDDLVREHLVGWRLERLGMLERALARMATWELVHRSEVPTGVVLSEAVSLATQYCGSESARFLNGVLKAVANKTRGSDQPPPPNTSDQASP